MADIECNGRTCEKPSPRPTSAIRHPALSLLLPLFLILLVSIPADAQFIQRRRPESGPQPKNIRGIVQDMRGRALADARVFVRDMKSNVTRTLTTDQQGIYSIFALPPNIDYEVYADFLGQASEKKYVSGFLDRQDNVLNFQIEMAAIDAGGATDRESTGPQFDTFDLVTLRASFQLPTGVPAPIPAALLLHGYGEDRSVWNSFRDQLLSRGWAVMTVDLRGHGESRTKNRQPIQATTDWRASSHEFPQDLDPSLDWLKAQPRIDNNKVVIIGSDIGANLALIASGKFPEVRTVVAINPNLTESLSMAGSAQDFTPKSALLIVTEQAPGDRLRTYVAEPVRVLTAPSVRGTAQSVADRAVTEAIFQWLSETY
jgi:pimeloyl-ACP methyl ester carboxylesterase